MDEEILGIPRHRLARWGMFIAPVRLCNAFAGGGDCLKISQQ